MKRLFLSIAVLASVCAHAVNYCDATSWGYAGTVTGGGNATPTLVKNESELKNALKSENSVVIITQDITVSNQVSIDGKSNITLLALPGVRLISTIQEADNSGILAIKNNSTNIILRNLTFEGPGAYDCDGRDNLSVSDAQRIWVDHCDFQDGLDGNFDINRKSDNISVTWCRFRYFKEPKAGGPGGSDDHRFSNLVGSSSSDKPSDGTYNITYAFCWWDEGCKQRMTRCRNAELHFLNCYWNSSVSDYYIGPENAKCYFEGCTFAGKANDNDNIWQPFSGSTNYCKFVNCEGNLPYSTGGVDAPSYQYDKLKADKALTYVTHATCCAGATLEVYTDGDIFSVCPNEDPGDDPEPVAGECCVSLGLGEAPTAENGGIPEDYSEMILSYSLNHSSSLWMEGYLNLGSNADYITFDFSAYHLSIQSVTFDVTIPNWAENKNTIAYHWNNDENSQYSIASKNREQVTLTAPENAKSFTIQRSASTGTRISEVCLTLVSDSTSADVLVQKENAARKVLRNGQVLIMRDAQIYSLFGIPVD